VWKKLIGSNYGGGKQTRTQGSMIEKKKENNFKINTYVLRDTRIAPNIANMEK